MLRGGAGGLQADLVLLDSWSPLSPGGTGQALDWDFAREIAGGLGRVVLAGGLHSENVALALATVRPFGVDVSSGVERSKGVKDPERIRLFIRKVREHDGGCPSQ